jgi:hypothetical protein
MSYVTPVHQQKETRRNLRKDIQQHPPYQHKLPLQNKNDSLQAVHGGNHDDGDQRQGCFAGRDDNDEVEDVAECSGENLSC